MTVGSQVQGLLSSLQSIDATLSSLAIKTKEHEAREAFHQGALKTRTIIKEIQKRAAQIEFEEPTYQQ
ncbi:DUF1657 domain-containing protein [Halalkalibacter akibai]|uniref:DUF1657 domain-containing protein n=1 Tax=Halalkalibacter akibai (strain ATCC 43226 / DSM 21942 / CIP 109018 / JCM 9157 / 1139) TaxID=1236973 RepID=W4QVC1_HALA3|nr:DUF1657 domain-containing protein [Halalkalibacter akibai]GAE35852.1 hypothetical protein JCM9157_2989 [Halalkalibacter akibai JCM 9157]